MLRDLTIKNYRAFKDFSIDGLARVNLIVGDNNAGKTSFLEAVYLLKARSNPSALLELLNARGEYNIRTGSSGLLEYDFPVSHIFFGHAPKLASEDSPINNIEITSKTDENLRLHITLRSLPSDVEGNEWASLLRSQTAHLLEPLWHTFRLQFDYARELQGSKPVSYFVADDLLIKPGFVRPDSLLEPNGFVTAEDVNFNQLAPLWDDVALTSKESNVIAALQILEPEVEGIRFTSRQTVNSGAVIKLRSQASPIPLGSMGTGMRHALVLATAAVTTDTGVLLVDEIDTGLYYRAQADIWRLLLKVAKERDIQIFATTHSWDCVEAFQEALAEGDNAEQGYLFRLQRRGDRIDPVGYTSDDLDVAVRQAIEVR